MNTTVTTPIMKTINTTMRVKERNNEEGGLAITQSQSKRQTDDSITKEDEGTTALRA